MEGTNDRPQPTYSIQTSIYPLSFIEPFCPSFYTLMNYSYNSSYSSCFMLHIQHYYYPPISISPFLNFIPQLSISDGSSIQKSDVLEGLEGECWGDELGCCICIGWVLGWMRESICCCPWSICCCPWSKVVISLIIMSCLVLIQ